MGRLHSRHFTFGFLIYLSGTHPVYQLPDIICRQTWLAEEEGFSTHHFKSVAFAYRARLAVSQNRSTTLRLFESRSTEAVQSLRLAPI